MTSTSGNCMSRAAVHAASIIGLAAVWILFPFGACGQSSWPGYPNNNSISITSGGNVGIGTTAPGGPLTVTYAANGQGQLHLVDSSTPNTGNANVGLAGFGSNYVNNYTTAGRTWYIGNPGGSAWAQQFLVWNDRASDTLFGTNATERMRITSNGNVGVGTANPQYLLAVNGTIGAKDVVVTNTGWSDYVFQPGYRLRTLREVGAFVQANHRLPDIPSEAEVKEKGVSVGEMQAKFLAKIEELTLHMIQADDRNIRLEQQNQELRERIARLEQAIAGIPAVAK